MTSKKRLDVTKDGPTRERRVKGDLDYIIEAGPENRGTVGHFRVKMDGMAYMLYDRGTLTDEQYQAAAHYETVWAVSGLSGRPQTGRMERTDGHNPVTPERILDAKETVFQVRWWMGNTDSKLLERVIGEGRSFADAAALSGCDGVGYGKFSRDTARRRLVLILEDLSYRWGFARRKIA